MYMWRLLPRAVLCLLLFGPSVKAQVSSVYGSLRVTVVDPTGAAVSGATVLVRLPSRNWSRQILTGPEGEAYFAALVPGDYGVAVEAPTLPARKQPPRSRG